MVPVVSGTTLCVAATGLAIRGNLAQVKSRSGNPTIRNTFCPHYPSNCTRSAPKSPTQWQTSSQLINLDSAHSNHTLLGEEKIREARQDKTRRDETSEERGARREERGERREERGERREEERGGEARGERREEMRRDKR